MLSIKKIFADPFHLFYPHHCCGCGHDLSSGEELLCLRCIQSLPHTGFEMLPANPVEKMFWGRADLKAAHSQFYFSKGQVIQQLIHQLKYKNNKTAGIWLGNLTGEAIISSGRFGHIDYLVPLPMFPAKEFKRGYNQAAIICDGMSEAMNVPVLNNNVVRQRPTETQTKKHRAERWLNVDGSFISNEPKRLEGKHILLADDVLTTGATLDACCQCLQQIKDLTISIATLAVASK